VIVSVSVLTLCIRYLRVYHWVDTSAGRLLVSEGIIRPVVSVSVLKIYNTQCQYRNTDYWADDTLEDQ
jgi:hypothetical protein